MALSFSALTVYETCPKWYDLQYNQHSPVAPRGEETAGERGRAIHKQAEDYVKDEKIVKLPATLRKFEYELNRAKELYAAELAFPEIKLGVDSGWNLAPWETAWLRLVIDLYVRLGPSQALLVDYKTGKRYGNEIKHGRQLLLYTIIAFCVDPSLEEISAQLWYLDLKTNNRIEVQYTRKDALKFFPMYNGKFLTITDDTDFTAAPSEQRCMFCPYAARKNKWVEGTGICTLNKPSKYDLITEEAK